MPLAVLTAPERRPLVMLAKPPNAASNAAEPVEPEVI